MKTKRSTNPTVLVCLQAVLFFLIPVPQLSAQLSEYTPLTSGGIDLPSALAAGDLDGDGAPDIISTSEGDGRIAWYRNLGDEQFSQQITLSLGIEDVADVEIGDLDNDGDLDLVAPAPADSTVLLFFNDGNGTFTTTQVTELHVHKPSGVELSDLDQDEDLDIVWFSSARDTIGWLINEGAGAFTAGNGIASELDGLFSIQIADLDGDADPDVLYSQTDYNLIGWIANNGAGQFAPPTWMEDEIPQPRHILATDLNGDDRPEVLAVSYDEDALFIFPNAGGGQFEAPQMIAGSIAGFSHIRAADLDLDGDRDLLVRQPEGNLSWLINNGQGAFPVIEEITVVPGDIWDLALADIDQNGRTDIVYLAYWDHIEWLPNEEVTPFSRAVAIARISKNPKTVSQADMNQDGFPDLLVEGRYKMFWFPNDGNGDFGPPVRFYKNQYDGAGMLQAGDLTGDGLPDMVCGRFGSSGGSSDNVRWKRNNGGGDFQGFDKTLSTAVGIFGLTDIATADLTGNGVDDIVYASFNQPGGNQVVGWFENNGEGQFSLDEYIDTETGYNTLVNCTDLDGDGRIDILVHAGYVGPGSPPSIFWFQNLGDGNFASRSDISSPGTGYKAAFPADLNSDGLTDVLVWQAAFGLFWFRNLGDGDFASRVSLLPLTDIEEMVPTDFDRDGDTDIVYIQESTSDLKWFENQGPAFFQPSQLLATGAFDITGLKAEDLDADGYPEIITWSWTNNATGYYKNLTGRAAISGFCFHDENQNGVFDPEEQPLPGIPVFLDPDELIAFSDAEGRYRFNLPPGDYTIEAGNRYCWERLVDSTYALNLTDEPILGPDFGYAAGDSQTGLIATVALSPLRCDQVVPAWIVVENPNCITAPGEVELVFDGLLSVVHAEPPPASINGDTVFWDLDSIPAAQSRTIYLELQVDDATQTGQVATIIAQVNPQLDPDDPLLSKQYEISDTIRCSYDPNDKLVNLRDVPIDYLPAEHELVYTLRFQNTGNDVAYRVRLEDQLSEDLDWSTVRPLGASHPYYLTQNMESGRLEFVFDNILLPDSTTDEPGSHGFVQFAVHLQPGLPPGTVVPNGAGIYFDSNPAVLTNTVETRIVDPTSTDAPPEPRKLNVYPNPGTGLFWVRFERPAKGQLIVSDAMGRRLLSRNVEIGTMEQQVNLSEYPAGVYYLQWQEKNLPPVAARIILQVR